MEFIASLLVIQEILGVTSAKWPNKTSLSHIPSEQFGIHPLIKVPLWERWDPSRNL